MEANFVAKKRFFDNKNYPRGFSRQGDFTIKEAQLLEKHGEAFKDLVSGKRQPETELEKSFVDAVNNNKAPSNEYEKVWMKYQRLISKVKKFHTLSGGKPQLEGAEDYSDSDE